MNVQVDRTRMTRIERIDADIFGFYPHQLHQFRRAEDRKPHRHALIPASIYSFNDGTIIAQSVSGNALSRRRIFGQATIEQRRGYEDSHCPRHARPGVGENPAGYFLTITLTFAHAAPSHSNEVSFPFRREVLHWLLYREGRHPCLPEQA